MKGEMRVDEKQFRKNIFIFTHFKDQFFNISLCFISNEVLDSISSSLQGSIKLMSRR